MNMRKKMIGLTTTILATGAVLAFGAGIIGSTIASEKFNKYGDDSRRPVGDEMSEVRSALPMQEIVTKLKEQGYTEVYEIEQERGVYEVKALHPKQGRVELYVDASSGEVLKQEVHD
jgi:hypothetical protein